MKKYNIFCESRILTPHYMFVCVCVVFYPAAYLKCITVPSNLIPIVALS